MRYINTYNQYNEGIRSGLAKAGLIGSLLTSSPAISSTRNSFDIDGVEYNQIDKLRQVQKNVFELSELRKNKSRDQELSSILSEIQQNLTSSDSSKFIELFDKLSKHIESKYGYKIPDKKVEELTDAGVSELKKGNDGITLISIIGWLGSICLAVCGVPQAWASHKDKHSHGISWAFLLLWAFGELFALTYVYDKLDLPLLLNYSINILILSVILYYKAKPFFSSSFIIHNKTKDISESKIFESFEEELVETFSGIISDTKIVTIPYIKTYETKPEFNIYVLYGGKNEDDSTTLRELYDYQDIVKNIFNKEYFHISLIGGQSVVVLKDYKDKYGEIYLKHLNTSCIWVAANTNRLPINVAQILGMHHNSTLSSGIKYSDGSSSNLCLWKYAN